MRRHLTLGAILLLLLLPLAACGAGSSEEAPAPPAPPVPPEPVLTDAQVNLAVRLDSGHLDNGAFDWRQNIYPYDTSVTGYSNVTGVTALGLAETWFSATPGELPNWIGGHLEETRFYILGVMRGYIEGSESSVSLPNFIFLRLMKDHGLLADNDWEVAQHAFGKLLDDRDDVYGNVDGVISDGIWNRIYDIRASIPGIRGWDLTFIYKALVAMDWPESERDWVFIRTVSLDIPTATPGNDTDGFGIYGVTHVLELCALHPNGAAFALPWRYALNDYEMSIGAGARAFGWWDGVDTLTPDHQGTAYAVMALAAWGEDVSAYQAWLDSEVGAEGWLYEDDGYEYFEVMGEVLQAFLVGDYSGGGSAKPSEETLAHLKVASKLPATVLP